MNILPQPVLGILTLYLNDRKQLEERKIYERMTLEGHKIGLKVIVFTPSDVSADKNKIQAMMFDPIQGKWSRSWRPFPDMIFDRCRIQKSKRFEQLRIFRRRYGHLHFLNKPLRDKWTIYQVLSRRPEFKNYLPDTDYFNSLSDIYAMLKKNNCIYIKPIQGTGGRGILCIEKLGSQMYRIQGRNRQRKIVPPQKLHLSRMGPYLLNWKKGTRFLVQEGIDIRLPNGRVHDYRMLVQKNGSGVWSVTGCAGRIGPARSVTSNLHGGGSAAEMNTLLKTWIHSEQKVAEVRHEAERVSLGIASYLDGLYGPLCELALDLAIDRSGHIYVLEVNPKPAREVFARSGDKEAYRNAILKPLEYALWSYKQKAKKTDPLD
ncbi:YheC/YheD family protein [Paenibacillus physcomitrellae]|uniref:YheC/YheD family endospore coat-associated protein n=1 Tax=Paenibacillus physcomitrellae TaxID=1619311 RepID=UPI001E3561AA|nr:YheC/YheD family protein [Paenibacillus physcomitrellae]